MRRHRACPPHLVLGNCRSTSKAAFGVTLNDYERDGDPLHVLTKAAISIAATAWTVVEAVLGLDSVP